MTALSVLLAFISGAAANQLDAPLSRINARGWELIARYIVGILAGFAPFVALVHAINPKATRDAALSYAVTFVMVGAGVGTMRALRDLVEVKA